MRNEIASLPEKFFIFVDDNLTGDREYAEALFRSPAPLGEKWIGQSTLGIADDPRFVELAAQSGCIGLSVGLETFSGQNPGSVRKTFNQVDGYREAVRLLHSHGIGVESGIVFGFDKDTPEVFQQTLDMPDALGADVIQVSVFTPLPGTPRFRAMESGILDRDWAHYDFHNVVFQPRKLSRAGLQAGYDWVTREFSSPNRIVKRILRHLRRPGGFRTLPYHIALSLAYFGRVFRWKIRGYNPAGTRGTVPRTFGKTGPAVVSRCPETMVQR